MNPMLVEARAPESRASWPSNPVGYYFFGSSTHVLFTCLCIYSTRLYYSSCVIYSSPIHRRIHRDRSFAHGAIFFIRDYNPEQNEDNVLARMLEHEEAIISHLSWVSLFLGLVICSCVISLGKVTNGTHFCKQQQSPSTSPFTVRDPDLNGSIFSSHRRRRGSHRSNLLVLLQKLKHHSLRLLRHLTFGLQNPNHVCKLHNRVKRNPIRRKIIPSTLLSVNHHHDIFNPKSGGTQWRRRLKNRCPTCNQILDNQTNLVGGNGECGVRDAADDVVDGGRREDRDHGFGNEKEEFRVRDDEAEVD
ncbi:Photosystem I PsaA/PsaB, partial [Cynara cardunculus var. scolymus]